MISKYITTQGELKVIDLFLKNKSDLYNFVKIKNDAKISYSTAKHSVRELLDRDLLVKVTKVGKSNLYKLNTDNPFIFELLHLFEYIKILK